MSTRETIQAYFGALRQKKDWKSFLADDLAFVSHGTPPKQLIGRDAYVESTKRFFSIIKDVEVRHILVDGDRACVLTRYDLQAPGGPPFESDVAEILGVRDGKIASLSIYFDSAPFPK